MLYNEEYFLSDAQKKREKNKNFPRISSFCESEMIYVGCFPFCVRKSAAFSVKVLMSSMQKTVFRLCMENWVPKSLRCGDPKIWEIRFSCGATKRLIGLWGTFSNLLGLSSFSFSLGDVKYLSFTCNWNTLEY